MPRKLIDYGTHKDGTRIIGFECPGCGYGHAYRVNGKDGPQWEWNESMDAPTFRPSLLVYDLMPDGSRRTRCHLFMTNGRIEFLSDCMHALAGTTVDVPDVVE
jgi:hypothetical protein